MRIRRTQSNSWKTGQTAIEYMLLFGIVVSVVMVGFKVHLSRIHPATNTFFHNTVNQMYGATSPCGDGICSPAEAANNSCPCDPPPCFVVGRTCY